MMTVKTDGSWFKDEHGRTLILRGVNLGGSSKVPVKPNGATWNREGFFDHRNVSFVGRPFPLKEADEHLGRLREWGLTFLRFLVTWEAIEHAGPGIYDEEYLDYLYAVVKKAGEYGIHLFIDPHQDGRRSRLDVRTRRPGHRQVHRNGRCTHAPGTRRSFPAHDLACQLWQVGKSDHVDALFRRQ
jgi:hypothetical protein